MRIPRRDFLRLTLAGAAALLSSPSEALGHEEPILDSHIHLFDPRRPGGIPWPLPDDSIYAPTLPDRYETLAAPFGIRGAIVVEASPRLADNDWVLQVASANPIIVGFIGDLIPGPDEFAQQLDRLRVSPLFRGTRYGNLWNRDLAIDSQRPGFMDGLRRIAVDELTFESANPTPALISTLLRISNLIPDLRIVVDHLPSLSLPVDAASRKAYLDDLRHLATNVNIFVKLSEIPVKVDGRTRFDPSYYCDHLDQIWETFGEDRVLFGSDWPNSEHIASYMDTLNLARSYIATKSTKQRHKFFWSNSIRAYQWKPRRHNQDLA